MNVKKGIPPKGGIAEAELEHRPQAYSISNFKSNAMFPDFLIDGSNVLLYFENRLFFNGSIHYS